MKHERGMGRARLAAGSVFALASWVVLCGLANPLVQNVILNVEPDGPAATAGVLIGDILIALDGRPVADTDDVQAVLDTRVGSTTTVSVIRGGAPRDLSVTVAERPQRNR